MYKIRDNGKRLWLAGREDKSSNEIVQYHIYFWSIGKVKYDDNLGCMFVVSRMRQQIIAVLYIHREEFFMIKRAINKHFEENTHLRDFEYGEQWEFSMMKCRHKTVKMSL